VCGGGKDLAEPLASQLILWRLTRPDALSVLHDEKVMAALGRYFRVVDGDLPAKYVIARTVRADFDSGEDLRDLWDAHTKAVEEFNEVEHFIRSIDDLGSPVEQSLLELKSHIAARILERCVLCERRCRVNRMAGERGVCKAGLDLVVSSMFDHYGEEPELVPSFTVFTLGCSFRCLHCQNYTISQWLENGETLAPATVSAKVDDARRRGARNLNCVGGNPDQYLWPWLKVLLALKENTPIVWNSNAYYSEEEATLLHGAVDVYLLDFKYGNDDCAREISGVDHYTETVTRNHRRAKDSAELIVRVLVLPGHLECCLENILSWIRNNLGASVRVNLMWQYRPEWKAFSRKELSRRLTRSEMLRSLQMARAVGLDNVLT